MKVIIITSSNPTKIGGIESSIKFIARELKERDLNVEIQYNERKASKTNANYFSLHNFSAIKNITYLNKTADNNNDLIIVRDDVIAFLLSLFLRKKNIIYIPPWVVCSYIHTIYVSDIKEILKNIKLFIKTLLISRLQKIAIIRMKKIVVFSNNMFYQVSNVKKGNSGVYLIKPGITIDNNKLHSLHNNEKYYNNLCLNKKVFVFIGRLEIEKDVFFAIKSFAKTKNINSLLIVVGNGKYYRSARKFVIKNNLSNRIFFTGFCENPQYFYSISHYLITTSNYESYGHVINEALSFGVPVIGFRNKKYVLTACEDLIIHNFNGFLLNKQSEEEFAQYIDYLVSFADSIQYKIIKKNCIKYVQTIYSWEKFVDKIIAIAHNEVNGDQL